MDRQTIKKLEELMEYRDYLYRMYERENDLYMEGYIRRFSRNWSREIARVSRRIARLS